MSRLSLTETELQEVKNCLLDFVKRVTSMKRGNPEHVLEGEIAILPEIVKLLICPAQCKAYQCHADSAPTPPFEEFLRRESPAILRLLGKGKQQQRKESKDSDESFSQL